MDINSIKNTREFFWTNHSKYKLLQYGLSPTLIKKVIRKPERTENGIAPETTAVMIRKDTKKSKKEIWVMVQNQKSKNNNHKSKEKISSKNKIISAWIYPGISPQGKDIYIPEDVWEEIESSVI